MVCFVHFDLEMCFAPQRCALFSTSEPPKVVRTWCDFVHFDLEMCFAPQRRALFRHLNFQKWSVHGVILYILTWKCASRHNGVHFFDILTSKSGPYMVWFCTFWLRNVLRATTACTFSTSQLTKEVRSCCFNCIYWEPWTQDTPVLSTLRVHIHVHIHSYSIHIHVTKASLN